MVDVQRMLRMNVFFTRRAYVQDIGGCDGDGVVFTVYVEA